MWEPLAFLPAQTKTACKGSLCGLELWKGHFWFLVFELLPCFPQVALRLPPAARVLSRVLQVGATPITQDPHTDTHVLVPHVCAGVPCTSLKP